MKPFLSEDFLLHTQTAKLLYQQFAKPMPIFDYHCHLPVGEIAQNKTFKNLTEIWLKGDHYKWRAMRANGIDERLITGDAGDFEKFRAWTATVPKTLRNPLFHWTHMELKTPFGITGILLNPNTAKEIYDKCNEMLKQDDFSARAILKKLNVKVVCTTDDPTDDLSYHRQIKEDSTFSIKVLPTFRPDKAMSIENPEQWNGWISKLEQTANISIHDYSSFLRALKNRHDAFHDIGCRS
ncbi:MAG: glucuronate isomerase, partial [Deltaproteobacteria bacterium]|nr:glucuronate isomerase [Deltaproteobacteria bacterium]